MAMGNQWHCGPMGPVGMRIEALEPLMRAKRIPEDRWPNLIDAMLAMEQAALEERQKAK